VNNQENSKASDAKLINLAKRNPEAFGFLIERYKDALTRYIRRLTYFSPEDIEDILQEVFLKVYQNLNDYDERLKFSAWIFRIARNHAFDVIRRNKSRPQLMFPADSEIFEWLSLGRGESGKIDLEREVELRDCRDKIEKIIKKLPLKYRDALVLRFLEEKSYEEMMDILKKPKGSVATLVNRGKKLLVKYLRENKIECF
jgi:RNA polymerase sigma-70 factor (ECF subfamily)